MEKEDVEEMILREREIVLNTMKNKLSDNISKGSRKGREVTNLKGKLFWRIKREDERRRGEKEIRRRVSE